MLSVASSIKKVNLILLLKDLRFLLNRQFKELQHTKKKSSSVS